MNELIFTAIVASIAFGVFLLAMFKIMIGSKKRIEKETIERLSNDIRNYSGWLNFHKPETQNAVYLIYKHLKKYNTLNPENLRNELKKLGETPFHKTDEYNE